MVYWIIAAVLLVYMVLVWFIGTLANPPGSGIWFLRGGLWLIGLIGGAFAAWWFHRQREAAQGLDSEFAPSAALGEVDLLVRDAVRRLKKSAMARGSSLGNLPLIFLVGDPGSAKTTTIVHSALDPELLAGHVYQDNAVVPTRIANFWYTRQAVFVDGGGGIFSQPDLWKRLIKLVQPGHVASAGKKQQAPRAAIVCFDYESFLRPGANEATLSAARRLGTRLNEVSQLLGISFPIYVLFTRADRIGARSDGGSLFLDYVAGLNKDETAQVLGATLPVRSLQATGVYAEEETRRLEKAFDELFYSLSDKRIDLLSIAGQTDKLPGIYEFPRELRKRRDLLVQFLVDLARPSQLNVNPFLRGFYFSGVRPVIIEEMAAAVPEPALPDAGFNPNATVVFGASPVHTQAPADSYRASSRKLPEWVFLSQLFNEVILKDRVALSASGFSSRVSLLRRIAFGTVAVIAAIFAVGFVVSFIGNFSLEQDVKQAVNDVRTIHATDGQIPSIDQLQKLDRLRQQLETLSSYKNGESHWHLRWGLYSGDNLYSPARQSYFEGFKTLLFDDAEKRLQTALIPTKAKPDANDSYLTRYNDLRAYLITTGYAKYSTRDFLFPILYGHWGEGRNPDGDTSRLVMGQFDYYSSELAIQDPYHLSPDMTAVNRDRDFLQAFTGIDVPYFKLLSQAQPPGARDLNFRSVFPNSAGVVDAHDIVKAAFTLEGFAVIDSAINRPDSQKNEDWVLGGKSAATDLDPTTLRQRLRERYQNDYIQQWKAFLDHSHVVVSQTNPGEAANKLETLTGAASPLLELIWFVSHNSKVSDDTISSAFASVQAIEPPGPDNSFPTAYKLAANASYTDALSTLKENLNVLAKSNPAPNDTHLADQANASAETAKTAADKTAGSQVDRYGITASLTRLLREPAVNAQLAIGGAGKGTLNAGGKNFCQQFDELKNSFPFNGNGPDLPLDQLNSVLAPNTGALWAFYSGRMQQFVVQQGTHYVANESASIKVSPEFVRFFNRAADLSHALYAGNPTPHVTYSMKQLPSNVEGVALKIGGVTVSGGETKTLAWTGVGGDVQATRQGTSYGTTYSGPWAIFRYISDGHPTSQGAETYNLTFVQQTNGRDNTLPNGKKESYSYQIQFTGATPLSLDYFTTLTCVSAVAR